MFGKIVILKIYCSNTPCQLTIFSCDNKIIKTCTLTSPCSEICFCTKGCFVKLLAQYQGQTLCQIINLHCCFCEIAYVNLVFANTYQINVSLRDENYGLPVPSANLNFQLNQS